MTTYHYTIDVTEHITRRYIVPATSDVHAIKIGMSPIGAEMQDVSGWGTFEHIQDVKTEVVIVERCEPPDNVAEGGV